MSEQRWAVMCSMTGYWGVVRPEHVYREDDGLLACIEWESLHDTWAEAIQEADRQARTVTVTLPAVSHIPGSPVTLSSRYSQVTLATDELEYVALQLLSIHHQEKRTP